MTQSAITTKKFTDFISLEMDELARLKDEIRLKFHLAGMEGRSTWRDVEKQLEQIEERFGYEGDHAVETTRQIAAEVRIAAREFKAFLTLEMQARMPRR
jgi:hypothetical protein